MIKPTASPARSVLTRHGSFSPQSIQLLQLAVTLLAGVYMLLIGGTFDAGLRYRVQLLNTSAAVLVAAAWLILRRRRGGRVAVTGLEWPLALFALSQWLALLTSAQPRLGLEWVASVTMWAAALLVLTDTLRAGWPRTYVLNALLLLAAFISLQGLAEIVAWYAGWFKLGQWPPSTFRLNGWLGHANLTAAFLITLLPLALVSALRAAGLARRVALAALTVGMLVALFFTSSRAGWLACAFGLGTLAALSSLQPSQRAGIARLYARWRALTRGVRWLWVVGTLIAAGLLGALLVAQSQHITHGPLFISRENFWRVAWNIFQLQPLTGGGPDLYPWYYTRWIPSPPDFFAPHAHSLPMQILAGSGLIGLAALVIWCVVAGWRLVRIWLTAGDPPLLTALMAGLAALALQQLFDYLLGSPFILFIVVVVLALALSDTAPVPRARASQPVALLPAFLAPLLVAAFALRGAAWNERGLTLAAKNDWPAAAAAFRQAATSDPGLTLYWQQAAYAYTRAGDLAAALPLWQRAASDDAYWPLLPATIGVLSQDRAPVENAQALARSGDHLFALNLGVLAEAGGDSGAAQAAYELALSLRPASAQALFWQQTALRQAVVADWLAAQAAPPTAFELGQQALAAGQAQLAVEHFRGALEQNPLNGEIYAGLAAAYQALGDTRQAHVTWQTGLWMPVTIPEETLSLRLLAGDWARAGGDLAAAAQAYGEVFSIVNDYTSFGPGTYGRPHRSWYVYHREALPADLVPQFARANITAVLDERFAWLAAWTAGQGDQPTACYLAGRVWREAPVSASGAYWEANCR